MGALFDRAQWARRKRFGYSAKWLNSGMLTRNGRVDPSPIIGGRLALDLFPRLGPEGVPIRSQSVAIAETPWLGALQSGRFLKTPKFPKIKPYARIGRSPLQDPG
jgi:hypothetical protein